MFIAAKWLIDSSLLFRNEGIVINETWLEHPQQVQTIPEQQNENQPSSAATTGESDDDWTEGEGLEDRPTGNLDTCLQSLDQRI